VQPSATQCNTLQHTATHSEDVEGSPEDTNPHCYILQHISMQQHCNRTLQRNNTTLQHNTATQHCNATLQYTLRMPRAELMGEILDAIPCNTLQHTVDTTLQHNTATQHCNATLQYTLRMPRAELMGEILDAIPCNTLQHTVDTTLQHCNTALQHNTGQTEKRNYSCIILQHTATHCNTLQHTATIGTHCNTTQQQEKALKINGGNRFLSR